MAMKTYIVSILIFCCSILAPNIFWLSNSTARIKNEGLDIIHSVAIYVDEKKILLGNLSSGESRFTFLPNSGDATYKVVYEDDTNLKSVCESYVESDMYHIETLLEGSTESECEVSIPIFSDLLILKLI